MGLISEFTKLWITVKNTFKQGSTKKSINLQKIITKNESIKDFVDVQRYVGSRMTYKYDPLYGQIDVQKDLDEITKDFLGDCDDYQMLSHRLNSQLGYRSQIVSVVTNKIKYSHVINVFKVKKKFYSISTEGLRGPFNSFNEWLKDTEKMYHKYFDKNIKIITYDIREGDKLKLTTSKNIFKNKRQKQKTQFKQFRRSTKNGKQKAKLPGRFILIITVLLASSIMSQNINGLMSYDETNDIAYTGVQYSNGFFKTEQTTILTKLEPVILSIGVNKEIKPLYFQIMMDVMIYPEVYTDYIPRFEIGFSDTWLKQYFNYIPVYDSIYMQFEFGF